MEHTEISNSNDSKACRLSLLLDTDFSLLLRARIRHIIPVSPHHAYLEWPVLFRLDLLLDLVKCIVWLWESSRRTDSFGVIRHPRSSLAPVQHIILRVVPDSTRVDRFRLRAHFAHAASHERVQNRQRNNRHAYGDIQHGPDERVCIGPEDVGSGREGRVQHSHQTENHCAAPSAAPDQKQPNLLLDLNLDFPQDGHRPAQQHGSLHDVRHVVHPVPSSGINTHWQLLLLPSIQQIPLRLWWIADKCKPECY